MNNDSLFAPLGAAVETNGTLTAITEQIKLGGTTQATAKAAAEFLLSQQLGYCVPTKVQRKNIVVAFAESGLIVYGKAFDVVRCPTSIDYNDIEEVRRRLNQIVVCEIKSTNKKSVKPDFTGYFFSISTAELLTAQSLRERYRFLFVNTLTKRYSDLSLKEVFMRSKGIYPAWSVQF